MAGILITDNNGASGLGVDVDHQGLVTTNKNPQKAGAMVMFCENDDGSITGTRDLISPEVSGDFRQRSGIDTLFDSEVFDYASQNTSKHFFRLTTMAFALSGGALTTNSASSIATSIAAALSTNKFFPIYNAAPTYFETIGSLTALPGANTFIDFGGGIPGAANPYTPVDGVFFRFDSAGLKGVINNNGSETQIALTFTATLNQTYHFITVIDQNKAQFWIDDQLYGEIPTPVNLGGPLLSNSVPWFVRHAIVGGAAGSVVQFKVYAYGVSVGDYGTNKPWHAQMAGMGNNSAQGQSGMTQAGTALFPANSAGIATTVPTNTSNTGVGLGGRTNWALIASATTDLVLFGYQVPVGSAVLPGKSLYIKRIKITGSVVTLLVAPTAGIPLLSFDLGYGSTAVTLVTAESGSLAATTKIARKVPLGFMGFSGNVSTLTAPVAGCIGNELDFDFEAPLVVNPGEWVHVIARCVNAGAAGLVSNAVSINGYWE